MFFDDPIQASLLVLLLFLPFTAFLVARWRAGSALGRRSTGLVIGYYVVLCCFIVLFLCSADTDQAVRRALPVAGLTLILGPVVTGILLVEGSRLARRPRSMCKRCEYCGYNLTGNVSGICPECGEPVNWQPDMDLFTEDPAKQAEGDLGDSGEADSEVGAVRDDQRE